MAGAAPKKEKPANKGNRTNGKRSEDKKYLGGHQNGRKRARISKKMRNVELTGKEIIAHLTEPVEVPHSGW